MLERMQCDIDREEADKKVAPVMAAAKCRKGATSSPILIKAETLSLSVSQSAPEIP